MRFPHWLRSLAAPLTAPRPPHPAAPDLPPPAGGSEDRSLPSAVGFSTALPYLASATAVDPAGNVAVSTATRSTRFSPSGQLLASKASVPGEGGGIAVDAAGDVYLNKFGVITELDPTLQQTLFTVSLPGTQYSSFGGPGPGTGERGIAVAGGKIYAVGTALAGLPTTPNAYQTAFPGAATGLLSAYVAVIDPASSAPYHLTYCTYLGGTTWSTQRAPNRGASASGVAVDAAGAVYLTGSTNAADFPTTAGAFQTVNHGGGNGTMGWTSYVAKVDPTQSGAASLVYSTFLGGSGRDGYVTIEPGSPPLRAARRSRWTRPGTPTSRAAPPARISRSPLGRSRPPTPGPNVWAERVLAGRPRVRDQAQPGRRPSGVPPRWAGAGGTGARGSRWTRRGTCG